MSNSYRKAKSVAKDVFVHGVKMEEKVLSTMKLISDVVGSTLGPSGRPVLIERQEYGLPHMFTKDGVTVFRSLGFQDPTMHAIMEAARDAAVRTASEAGDGTTTATVLAEAIVRKTSAFCLKNPTVSPQKIARKLESVFRDHIEPEIKKSSIIPNKEMLHSVAKLSANGDKELADAVIKCFDTVGDDGNISILEISGPSGYEVETIKGYPISAGYEDSLGRFFPMFLNDTANSRTVLDKPVFVLYFGTITNVQTIQSLMEKVAEAWQNPHLHQLDKPFNYNVVIVATGFSESVLGDLGMNFKHPHTINVFPLTTPKTNVQNSEMHLLYDLAAVTGATVFDPMSNPLENAKLTDLGYGISSFEVSRYRSSIFGVCDEALIFARQEEIKRMLATSESKLDTLVINDRVAKLSGGIAKLKVIGPSNGELREKRDRAEDAVFAVRGAIKHGCLPGGGWMLKSLSESLPMFYGGDRIVEEILIPALLEPIRKIFSNAGMSKQEEIAAMGCIGTERDNGNQRDGLDIDWVYDAWENKRVDAIAAGILDSTPAVLEAIRSSISIACLLGTLGGTVVFKRDEDMEKQEATDTNQFMKAYDGQDNG